MLVVQIDPVIRSVFYRGVTMDLSYQSHSMDIFHRHFTGIIQNLCIRSICGGGMFALIDLCFCDSDITLTCCVSGKCQ